MGTKYSVVVVAYKDVSPEVEAIINAKSIRMIDEESDLVNFCNYGRQFDQDSRVCIYMGWYKKNIMTYLVKGYKVVILEIPFASNKPIVEALKDIDKDLGDQVLIIEYDEI